MKFRRWNTATGNGSHRHRRLQFQLKKIEIRVEIEETTGGSCSTNSERRALQILLCYKHARHRTGNSEYLKIVVSARKQVFYDLTSTSSIMLTIHCTNKILRCSKETNTDPTDELEPKETLLFERKTASFHFLS